MMRSRCTTPALLLAGILLLAITSPAGAAVRNPYELPPDALSASHSEGPFSALINPAFADFDDHSALAYRLTSYSGKNDGNHFAMVKLLGLAFHYGWYDHVFDQSTKTLNTAKASYCNFSKAFTYEFFTFGLGYSFSHGGETNYDDYKGWNLGFLLRPHPLISLGVSLRDMGGRMNGSDVKREDIYSLSLRPFTNRLTLSADIVHREGDGAGDMDYRFAVEGRIMSDITLCFRGDLDNNYMFGATLPFFIRTEKSGTLAVDTYMQPGSNGRPFLYSLGFSLPIREYVNGINLSTSDNYLVIRLNRTFAESEKSFPFRMRSLVFQDIGDGIRRAATDDSINGIILEIDSPGLGFAQVQELRDDIKNFRNSGKRIFAMLKSVGNKEYYLACACDRIYFSPNTPFGLEGLSADVYFFKGLMDKVGVKYESIRRGKFKSFNEPFTRSEMSPEFRENMLSLLSDLNEQFIGDISSDRHINRGAVEELLDRGIITPEDAKSQGFVDELLYPEEARRQIGSSITEVRLGAYISEEKKTYSWGPLPEIAVIYVTGTIVKGQSSDNIFVKNIGDDTYATMLREAFRDYKVKAIVIRVDSGGGSATASDFMWKTLLELKKEYNKPVIFSFGNTAASGGYYISCTGDPIFASRGTVTGSIGVISGRISLKELYAKLGINKETVKMSEFADIFDESRDLTDRERQMLQRSVDFIYDRFTERVVEARRIDSSEIPNVAEGRVFTGNQAQDRNLVNQMGGLSVAIEYAVGQTGLAGREYKLRILPNDNTYLKALLESNDTKFIARYIQSLVRHVEILQYQDEQVLMLCPYSIDIK